MVYVIVAGFVVGVPLLYAGECWWFPFGRCRCPFGCEGGRHYSKDRKHSRDCAWCGGHGRRLRVGRRVWNYFADRRRDAR